MPSGGSIRPCCIGGMAQLAHAILHTTSRSTCARWRICAYRTPRSRDAVYIPTAPPVMVHTAIMHNDGLMIRLRMGAEQCWHACYGLTRTCPLIPENRPYAQSRSQRGGHGGCAGERDLACFPPDGVMDLQPFVPLPPPLPLAWEPAARSMQHALITADPQTSV